MSKQVSYQYKTEKDQINDQQSVSSIMQSPVKSSRISVVEQTLNIPKLPALKEKNALSINKHQQQNESSQSATPDSHKHDQIRHKQNKIENKTIQRSGENSVYQQPSSSNYQNQLFNRNIYQSKMKTMQNEQQQLLAAAANAEQYQQQLAQRETMKFKRRTLIEIHDKKLSNLSISSTEGGTPQRRNNASTALNINDDSNSKINTYGRMPGVTHSQLQNLELAAKVYKNKPKKIRRAASRSDNRNPHPNNIKNDQVQQKQLQNRTSQNINNYTAATTTLSSQVRSNVMHSHQQNQHTHKTANSSLNVRNPGKDPNGYHTIDIHDQTELMLQARRSSQSQAQRYGGKLSGSKNGKPLVNQKQYNTMMGSSNQQLPSVVVQDSANAVDRRVINNGIIIPRKFSKVEPPTYNTSPNHQISYAAQRERNNTAMDVNKNSNQQANMKQQNTKSIYLNQQNNLIMPQPLLQNVATESQNSQHKRIQQKAQAYPVGNLNVNRKFKPVQTSSRHHLASVSSEEYIQITAGDENQEIEGQTYDKRTISSLQQSKEEHSVNVNSGGSLEDHNHSPSVKFPDLISGGGAPQTQQDFSTFQKHHRSINGKSVHPRAPSKIAQSRISENFINNVKNSGSGADSNMQNNRNNHQKDYLRQVVNTKNVEKLRQGLVQPAFQPVLKEQVLRKSVKRSDSSNLSKESFEQQRYDPEDGQIFEYRNNTTSQVLNSSQAKSKRSSIAALGHKKNSQHLNVQQQRSTTMTTTITKIATPLDQEIFTINQQLKDVNIETNYVKEDSKDRDDKSGTLGFKDLHQINQNSNESLMSLVNDGNGGMKPLLIKEQYETLLPKQMSEMSEDEQRIKVKQQKELTVASGSRKVIHLTSSQYQQQQQQQQKQIMVVKNENSQSSLLQQQQNHGSSNTLSKQRHIAEGSAMMNGTANSESVMKQKKGSLALLNKESSNMKAVNIYSQPQKSKLTNNNQNTGRIGNNQKESIQSQHLNSLQSRSISTQANNISSFNAQQHQNPHISAKTQKNSRESRSRPAKRQSSKQQKTHKREDLREIDHNCDEILIYANQDNDDYAGQKETQKYLREAYIDNMNLSAKNSVSPLSHHQNSAMQQRRGQDQLVVKVRRNAPDRINEISPDHYISPSTRRTRVSLPEQLLSYKQLAKKRQATVIGVAAEDDAYDQSTQAHHKEVLIRGSGQYRKSNSLTNNEQEFVRISQNSSKHNKIQQKEQLNADLPFLSDQNQNSKKRQSTKSKLRKSIEQFVAVKEGNEQEQQPEVNNMIIRQKKQQQNHLQSQQKMDNQQYTVSTKRELINKSPLKFQTVSTKETTQLQSQQFMVDRVTKAKQFDKQRRQVVEKELVLQKQMTSGQQEATTKKLLRMIESTVSLTHQNNSPQRQQLLPQQVSTIKKEYFQTVKPPSTVPEKKQYVLDDFDQYGILGRGSFGEVRLVKHKRTGELFALKVIQKNRIRGSKHIQHVKNERNILREITNDIFLSKQQDSSFFVNFIETMQDDYHLYLLQEYLPGGELLEQIKQQMSLTLQDSIFYLAEVLVAIQQLHLRNIIFRDLKPENILLDRHGHIKLIDFGFSKQMRDLKNEKARTNCGTPSYAAPEVLIGTGYGYKADIWSFGILICEILGGFTPFGQKAMEIQVAQVGFDYNQGAGFTSMPPHQIIDMVNSGRITLPKNLTPVTRDIVKKILVADPNVRLDIRDIMQHRFFEGVNWKKVAQKETIPPYVPSNHEEQSLLQSRKLSPKNTAIISTEEILSTPAAKGNESNPAEPTSSATLPQQQNDNKAAVKKSKVGSGTSSKSSPYIKRTNPNKILGDFHLAKLNQVFENF